MADDTTVRRLNWGCGWPEPGWINSDISDDPGIDISCDITEGLPLETGTIDYVVSVHALPEIPYREVVGVLQELRRVLKPGGTLRLVLPDLDRGIEAYLAGDRSYFLVPDEDARSIGSKFVVHMTWYGHVRTMFTFDFIAELLDRAGFADVTKCSFRWSPGPHAGIVELDNRERESLFVEATKPIS